MFERNIFINCPFDNDYFPILKAILFTIIYLELNPKISETSNSGQARITSITKLIKQSKYSIHDISRIELNDRNLPRFNMPFECGIDFGAKLSTTGKLKEKAFLILEKQRYLYQQFMSDIAGNDIRSHENDPEKAIKCVRDFLNANTGPNLTRYKTIWLAYTEFTLEYDQEFQNEGYDTNDIWEIPFSDVIDYMSTWIEIKKIPS